jgi:hypothetical protein
VGIYFSVGGTPLFLWKKAPIDFGTVSLPLNFAAPYGTIQSHMTEVFRFRAQQNERIGRS